MKKKETKEKKKKKIKKEKKTTRLRLFTHHHPPHLCKKVIACAHRVLHRRACLLPRRRHSLSIGLGPHQPHEALAIAARCRWNAVQGKRKTIKILEKKGGRCSKRNLYLWSDSTRGGRALTMPSRPCWNSTARA